MATRKTTLPESAPSEPSLPIQDIDGFLRATEYLAESIAGPWAPIIVPREYRYEVDLAWRELKPSLQEIRSQAANPPPGPRSLKTAGLFGSQLRLKLHAVSDAWRRFREKGTTKLLASLVGVTKTVVESLADLIPGAEALKEFLEFLEKLLKGEDPIAVLSDAA
jgi:hypothetical protein